MKKLHVLFVLTLGVGLFTLRAQAFHNEEVAYAAGNFARVTEHFHRLIHNMTGYSHLANDAHRLSSDARHFQRAVAAGASYEHALHDFMRIRSSFNHIRLMLTRAHSIHHNYHVRRDFRSVQYAFEDLEFSMMSGDMEPEPFPYDPHHG